MTRKRVALAFQIKIGIASIDQLAGSTNPIRGRARADRPTAPLPTRPVHVPAGSGDTLYTAVQAPDEPGGLHRPPRTTVDQYSEVVTPPPAPPAPPVGDALRVVAALAQQAHGDADRDQGVALVNGVATVPTVATEVVAVVAAVVMVGLATRQRRAPEEHRTSGRECDNGGNRTRLANHTASPLRKTERGSLRPYRSSPRRHRCPLLATVLPLSHPVGFNSVATTHARRLEGPQSAPISMCGTALREHPNRPNARSRTGGDDQRMGTIRTRRAAFGSRGRHGTPKGVDGVRSAESDRRSRSRGVHRRGSLGQASWRDRSDH